MRAFAFDDLHSIVGLKTLIVVMVISIWVLRITFPFSQVMIKCQFRVHNVLLWHTDKRR